MVEPYVCPCDDCPKKGGCGSEMWTRINPGLVRGRCGKKPRKREGQRRLTS